MAGMILEPESYFQALVPTRDALLEKLEAEAETEGIPIVGPVVGKLLEILALAAGAKRVLEVGAATGYSAIHLARACRSAGGRLTTFEQDAAMAERARANLEAAGLLGWAEVIAKDAREGLKALGDAFDLVFLDAEKSDYPLYLPEAERLLRPHGILVADNTAFQAAAPFNRAIAAHRAFEAVQLYSFLPGHSPRWDGLCLALRLKNCP